VLCIGVLEWAVGVGVFVKNQFLRWTGVVVLSGNAIVQLMMMPAYPFWSLSIFTLDIVAIYGLIAYGKRIFGRGLSTRNRCRRRLAVRHVFSRSRRHRSTQGEPRAVDDSDAGTPTTIRHTQQLQEWRRSAQRVTRAWNAWLAADSHDRAIRYRVFVGALADEETAAAALERGTGLPEAGQDVTDTEPRVGRLGAR
jgi:hypothetical protein